MPRADVAGIERRGGKPQAHPGRLQRQPAPPTDGLYRRLPDSLPDSATPAEETLRVLHELVSQGKIRYFGWSNYSAEMIAENARLSESLGLNRAISLQNSYSML